MKKLLNKFIITFCAIMTFSSVTASGSTPTLKIQVRKKNLAGLYTTTGNEFQKTGTGSTSKSYSLGSGNYKLYFYTDHSTAKANINGYVTK